MPLRSRVDEPGPAHLAGWSERVRPPLQRRRERRGSRYEGLRLRAVDRLAQGVLGAEDGHHACQPDRSKTGAAARGLGAFVRIPDHGPTWVQRCLDAGAHGVMAPHVDSVEQARALQVAARFPPHGSRGCGPTTRAGGWGLVPQSDYLTAESSVLGQVESDSGVEAADRMAKGRLVDSLFVGPADLGLSLGVEPGSDELRARIDRVRAVGAAAGLPVGIAAGGGGVARRRLEERFDYVVISNDATLLGTALRDVVGGARPSAAPPAG